MDDSLYDYLVSEILKGPYVKVTAWDLEKRTLVLTSVEIENQFNSFKSLFNLTFNLNVSESIQNEIQLRRQIVLVLRYLERKFNEIGFEYRIGEDGEEIRKFNWEKYVKYDFTSITTDNGWDNLYRNTKPDPSGEYEMDDGHMFGSDYDIEAEMMVRNQIIQLQEMFRNFKKEKFDFLSSPTNSKEQSPLAVKYGKNQPIPIDLKIKEKQEKLRRLIKDEINTLDNHWEYAFFNEKDCDDFIEILVSYFTDQEYSLPDDPIKTRNKCKTKLALALRSIYDLGTSAKVLRSDLGYFMIIKKLSAFSNLGDEQIYSCLTK